jgi:hypothetical protein
MHSQSSLPCLKKAFGKVAAAGVLRWKTSAIEGWGNNFRNIFQVSEQYKYIIVYLFMSGQK